MRIVKATQILCWDHPPNHPKERLNYLLYINFKKIENGIQDKPLIALLTLHSLFTKDFELILNSLASL